MSIRPVIPVDRQAPVCPARPHLNMSLLLVLRQAGETLAVWLVGMVQALRGLALAVGYAHDRG